MSPCRLALAVVLVAPVASAHTQTNATMPAPPAPTSSSLVSSKKMATLLAAALGGTVVLGGVAFGLWKTVLQPIC